MNRVQCVLVVAALALSALPEAGAAPLPEAARPWAEGVAPERQADALRLFKEGNVLFEESQYAAALGRYRLALAAWDHPAIHYNAAVAAIHLDQPLVAHGELEAALTYGDAPLGEELFKQAQIYLKLVSGQLAELEIVCSEPGAEVTLDGELRFVGPGRDRRWLLPGAHQLVANKPGFLSETRALQLPAGRITAESVTLRTLSSIPTRTVRRWPVWQPWTVLAAGAGAVLVGVPFLLDAKSNYDTVDAEIARACPSGCQASQLPAGVDSARSRARLENDVAVGLFVAGGVVVVTGVTLLILNQPHVEEAPAWHVSVVPTLSPGTAGVSASFRY
jgi:hypothetical protein